MLGLGVATGYLSLVVLLPLTAVVWESTGAGWDGFREAVSEPAAVSALKLTLGLSALVALVNAVMGSAQGVVRVRRDAHGTHSVCGELAARRAGPNRALEAERLHAEPAPAR